MINLVNENGDYHVTINGKEIEVEDINDGKVFVNCDLEDLIGVSLTSFPQELVIRVNSEDGFGTSFFNELYISAHKKGIELEFMSNTPNKHWDGYYGLSTYINAINEQVKCSKTFKVTHLDTDGDWKQIIISCVIPTVVKLEEEIKNAAAELKHFIDLAETELNGRPKEENSNIKNENNKIKKQNKKVKKEITTSWEEFTDKVDDLCEAIKTLDAEVLKSDAANFACFQIVTQAADNHYEGLGILQEVMMLWRKESLAAMEDESECIDEKISQLK
jgi:hypothetical protein